MDRLGVRASPNLMGRVMRVGFVVGEFPLLSETFVADQMAGLLARGFDVEVVCDRTKGDDRIDRQSEPMATLLARTQH